MFRCLLPRLVLIASELFVFFLVTEDGAVNTVDCEVILANERRDGRCLHRFARVKIEVNRFSDGAGARLLKEIGRECEEQDRLVAVEAFLRLFEGIKIDLVEILDVLDDLDDELAEVRFLIIDDRYGKLQVFAERFVVFAVFQERSDKCDEYREDEQDGKQSRACRTYVAAKNRDERPHPLAKRYGNRRHVFTPYMRRVFVAIMTVHMRSLIESARRC